MADQPQHDDELINQDNVSTGAEISTKNDVPANLNDGPDGAPQSAPAVALDRASTQLRVGCSGEGATASFRAILN